MAEKLLPVGRMIGGDLYGGQPVLDDNKQPVIDPKTQQPRVSFSIGYAIPKAGEAHWIKTDWGQVIHQVGAAAYPAMIQNPAFSWKVIDGDSTIPNKNNRRPCDQVGYPGHWVLWFSQGWAPPLVDSQGNTAPGLLQDGAVKPGDWIQIYAGIEANKPAPGKAHTPGIYLNPLAVAFIGYHADGRIQVSSIDTKAVGFGSTPLPPNVVSTPVGGMTQATTVAPPPATTTVAPPPAATATPGKQMTAAAGGATYEQMIAAGWTDETMIAQGMMVAPPAPNTAFLNVPTAPGATVTPPPPAAPVKTMTPAAGGATYEQMIAAGWTDETMIAQGMMTVA